MTMGTSILDRLGTLCKGMILSDEKTVLSAFADDEPVPVAEHEEPTGGPDTERVPPVFDPRADPVKSCGRRDDAHVCAGHTGDGECIMLKPTSR
jgi:hypothetical protein